MNDRVTHEDRRVGDSTQEDIRNLILNVVDFKDKAILLILMQMAENLSHNTAMTLKVSEKQEMQGVALETHRTDEKILIGKVAGAWWALSLVFGVAFVVFGVWFSRTADGYKDLEATVASHTVTLSAIPSLRKDIDSLQDHVKTQDSLMRVTK